ncbi:hypothetical protein [Flavobacterium sp.]|uniref:hypothetical protein n=1 Tax=unclassified Flavobacterium TaxID=196869 RepID=UPI0025C265A4|nr:hypothetical protein [Flavobacterium sp.]
MITKRIIFYLITVVFLSCQVQESKIDEIEFSYSSELRIPYNKVNINISKTPSNDSAIVLIQSKPLFDTPKWAYSKIDTFFKIDHKAFEKLVNATASLDKIDMDKAQRSGFDGSTWKIEFGSKGKNESYRFWSPTSQTKERGLDRFIQLSEHVMEISKLKKEEILKN